MQSLIPFNERDRLQALLACKILDTQAEACFDSITARAAAEFGVSSSLFGLIDSDRYWVKSSFGFDVKEIDRATAICATLVANDTALVLEDTLKDRRFMNHPLVTGSPFIRFYAGIPVRAGAGHAIGGFCIFDSSPRRLPWEEYILLQNFAKEIEHELSVRGETR